MGLVVVEAPTLSAPVTGSETQCGFNGHGGCSVRTEAWPPSWGGAKGFPGVRN